MRVVHAATRSEIDDARSLVEEYVASLNISLDFQDYREEISHFPGEYAAPSGALLVAYDVDRPVGVAALRPLDASVCEMKRMYVRPSYRGRGVGRALADALISHATERGYSHMRLDTLPSMEAALGLYRVLGFRDIAPYRYNPIPGAPFLELDLRHGPRPAAL